MEIKAIIDLFQSTVLSMAIEEVIEAFFLGEGKNIIDKFKLINSDNEILKEYLFRVYENSIIMNTIAFRNQKKTLYDLYYPLQLFGKNVGEDYLFRAKGHEQLMYVESKALASYHTMDFNYDCFEILEEHNKIIIIDMAGMGKSTIIRLLAVNAINTDYKIPIVVDLKSLDRKRSIYEQIYEDFAIIGDKNISKKKYNKFLEQGKLLILFDGYDEIAIEDKELIFKNMEKMIDMCPNIKFVITSRENHDLVGFKGFERYSIKPLEKNEAYELIRKYSAQENKDIGESLIEELEENENYDILEEFLDNPLMVSLLYTTYRYKGEVAYRKSDFYNQVYQALFNDHDKSKGNSYVHEKKTGVDIHNFETILQAVGFYCCINEEIAFLQSDFRYMLEKALRYIPRITVNISNLEEDLLEAVPLFHRVGTKVRWVHKSFCEYFAALFICRETCDVKKNMLNITERLDNRNLALFLKEIDEGNYRKSILKMHLERYIDYFNEVKNYFENLKGENDDVYVAIGISEINYVPVNVNENDLYNSYQNKIKDFIFNQMYYLRAGFDKYLIFDDFNIIYEESEHLNIKEKVIDFCARYQIELKVDTDVNNRHLKQEDYLAMVEEYVQIAYYYNIKSAKKIYDKIEKEIEAEKIDFFDI